MTIPRTGDRRAPSPAVRRRITRKETALTRKYFGYPAEEVLAAHAANISALAALQADTSPGYELFPSKPEGWSERQWADYMDDTADELRRLREEPRG